jgi:hypothetical protein
MVPYYVAKIACDLYLGTMRKLHRYKRLYCAVVMVGLKLRGQIVKPYMCPICRRGAEGGERPFKDRRGLFLHLTRKHYGDLIDMVVEAYNSIERPRKAMGVDYCGRVAGEVERVLPSMVRRG